MERIRQNTSHPGEPKREAERRPRVQPILCCLRQKLRRHIKKRHREEHQEHQDAHSRDSHPVEQGRLKEEKRNLPATASAKRGPVGKPMPYQEDAIHTRKPEARPASETAAPAQSRFPCRAVSYGFLRAWNMNTLMIRHPIHKICTSMPGALPLA